MVIDVNIGFLNRKILIVSGILALLLVIVLLVLFLFVFRGEPAAVTLKAAIEQVDQRSDTGKNSDSENKSEDISEKSTWVVDGDRDNFVGYRVNEELVGRGAFAAVGRTEVVSGSLTISNGILVAVNLDANLSKLKSDNAFRDGALRTQGIEWGTYPTTTFSLTTPLNLKDVFFSGEPISDVVKGDFTLHNVTKEIEITIEGQLINDIIVVTSSFTILFSDYEIEKPSSARVLSIEDQGVVEIQLFFKQ